MPIVLKHGPRMTTESQPREDKKSFPTISQNSTPSTTDTPTSGMSVTKTPYSTCTDLQPWPQNIPSSISVTATSFHETQKNSTLLNTRRQSSTTARWSPNMLNSMPRPKRQAASTTSYNLRQAWGNFDQFLAESSTTSSDSGSSDPEVDASGVRQPLHRNTKRRRGTVQSDDDSASDPYEDAEAGNRRGGKRARNTKSRKSGAKRTRTLMKLDKADMEVICEANGTFKNGRKRKNGKGRLRDLTRGEAETLTTFILEKTDWEGAADSLRSSPTLSSTDFSGRNSGQADLGHSVGSIVPRSIPETTGCIKTAEALSGHWKQVLSQRLVDMYQG